jgi:hypothetical protein
MGSHAPFVGMDSGYAVCCRGGWCGGMGLTAAGNAPHYEILVESRTS